jgi:hypothetical protein
VSSPGCLQISELMPGIDMPPICIELVIFHFSPATFCAIANEVPAQVSNNTFQRFFMMVLPR